MFERSPTGIVRPSAYGGEAISNRIGNQIELLLAVAREVITFGSMPDVEVALDDIV